MNRILFSFFLVIFSFIVAYAGQEDELFQLANEAYQSNDFNKAIKLYEQIGEMGFESAEMEYNLGNAYFRTERIGKSILHYERASLLAPGDEDVEHNLALAKQNVEGRDELPAFFLTSWWQNMRMLISSSAWGVIAIILLWIGFGGLCLWLMGKEREQRKIGFYVGACALIFSILPFSLAWSRMNFEKNSEKAIIIASDARLQSAPDSAGSEVLKLHEGEKVDLIDNLSGFWQVRLMNGEKGWVSENDLEEI